MATKTPSASRAEELCKRYAKLCGPLNVWKTWWQELGEYVMPRKAEITTTTNAPSAQREETLFDSTAIQSNMVLGNGMLSWMTPAESPWFSYDAPQPLRGSDVVKQYFRLCTEIAQLAMSQSNFYSEIHEAFLDRGAFGTAVIYATEGRKSPLNFTAFEIGSYALAEDDEGAVDTIFRELKLTARQLEMRFGKDSLSEKTQKLLDSDKCDTEIEILHAIYPRKGDEYDPSKRDGSNMPIASCYIEKAAQHELSNSGFPEMPAFATRYLAWGKHVYGWCPSWAALPDARQLNFLSKQLDALAEIKAFPRMLIPYGLEGDVDVTAGGVTFFDPNKPSEKPQEWLNGGDYRVGLERENAKKQAIKDAFHVDLFQMFAQLDKQMTAREVSERASEKLIQFSPTFARMTTELFNPLLQRIWGILARGGYFPPPPDELVQRDEQGNGYLPEPQVSYSSRIALAIKGLENNSFYRHVEAMLPLWQIRPELMDNYKWDVIERDLSANGGIPTRWIAMMDEVQQIRQARAQAQAAQQQQQQQMMQADMAHKAAAVKEDSVIARALPKAA